MNPKQTLDQLFWLKSANPGTLSGVKLQIVSPVDDFAGTVFFNLTRCGVLFFTEGVQIPGQDLIYLYEDPIREGVNEEFQPDRSYVVFDSYVDLGKTIYLNPQAYGLQESNYILEYISKLGNIHYCLNNFSFDLERDLILCNCDFAMEPNKGVVTYQDI